MFTRFIELVFGLFVALYLLVNRFGVAGCVRAFRRADPLLLLCVSGAVVFLLAVLAAQSFARWRKERERKLKERERSKERQRKAAERAAQQAENVAAPTAEATSTPPAPATTSAPTTAGDSPRYLRRHTMPDLLDGLMPDSSDEGDDLLQVVADTEPAAAPAAGDDYVI